MKAWSLAVAIWLLLGGVASAQETSTYFPAGSLVDMQGAVMCERLEPLLDILASNASAEPGRSQLLAAGDAIRRWSETKGEHGPMCGIVREFSPMMVILTAARVDGVRVVGGETMTVYVLMVADADGRIFFATSSHPASPAQREEVAL